MTDEHKLAREWKNIDLTDPAMGLVDLGDRMAAELNRLKAENERLRFEHGRMLSLMRAHGISVINLQHP